MPCACRWAAEKNEKRCCYAVSYTPTTWFDGLDLGYFGKPGDEGLESLAASKAISQMQNLEDEGAIHTIWTMDTSYNQFSLLHRRIFNLSTTFLHRYQ